MHFTFSKSQLYAVFHIFQYSALYTHFPLVLPGTFSPIPSQPGNLHCFSSQVLPAWYFEMCINLGQKAKSTQSKCLVPDYDLFGSKMRKRCSYFFLISSTDSLNLISNLFPAQLCQCNCLYGCALGQISKVV